MGSAARGQWTDGSTGERMQLGTWPEDTQRPAGPSRGARLHTRGTSKARRREKEKSAQRPPAPSLERTDPVCKSQPPPQPKASVQPAAREIHGQISQLHHSRTEGGRQGQGWHGMA